jgi:hypothetical protein
VGLYKQSKTEGVEPLDLANNANKLFDGNIRWEPGYTALETIQIINEGDLAFKYELSFTEGAVTGNGVQTLDIATIAQNFDVWVYDYYDNGNVAPKLDSYADISTQNQWDYVGTLAEVLAGKAVLSGNMETVRDANQDPQKANAGTTDGVRTVDTYTIALHMREATKDVALMGHKLSLSVKLVAYQKVQEADGFGNANYDSDVYVSSVEELQEALDKAEGETKISLVKDIEGNLTVTQKEGVKTVIDGAGNKLTGSITVDGKSEQIETAGLTIQNVNFIADDTSGDACIRLGGTNNTRYVANLTISNCTFDSIGTNGQSVAAVRSGTGGDKNLKIVNCVVSERMHSLVQVANVDNLVIENCKVYSKNGANFNQSNNVTVIGCTFDVKGYALRFGASSGEAGIAENYAVKNCTLKSACEADDDYVIVLRGTAELATLSITSTTITGAREIANPVNANVVYIN